VLHLLQHLQLSLVPLQALLLLLSAQGSQV
jgi:hypothetical protein